MSQTITLLVNDFREIQSLLQDLRSAGIPMNEIELIHKRPATIRSLFASTSETPRITDQDVSPILRMSNISDEDIRYCETRIDSGATALSIRVPDNSVDKVLTILKQHRIAVPNEKEVLTGQVLRKGTLIGGGYPNDLTRLEKIESIRVKAVNFDARGWDVKDFDDNKFGEIKYVIGSPTTGQPHFAVVDVGGLFKDKLIMVPFDRFRFDLKDKEAFLPFDKEQVKTAPNFTEKDVDYSRFSSYWDQLRETEAFAHSER